MLSTPHYLDSEVFWSRKTNVDRLFSTKSVKLMARASPQLETLPIKQGARVLDIGAGPGTLAVPLSKSGCEVTAVEPSEAMVASLEDYRTVKGLERLG
jgi:16S rRNA A1518/A1519 N6-dimethyltransferase RsmA/KsgA/DIM1 with predicted DNA glycosylase/AP lyase activity